MYQYGSKSTTHIYKLLLSININDIPLFGAGVCIFAMSPGIACIITLVNLYVDLPVLHRSDVVDIGVNTI